eukprot:356327-Chlamydomonas_euryale.AAC.4
MHACKCPRPEAEGRLCACMSEAEGRPRETCVRACVRAGGRVCVCVGGNVSCVEQGATSHALSKGQVWTRTWDAFASVGCGVQVQVWDMRSADALKQKVQGVVGLLPPQNPASQRMHACHSPSQRMPPAGFALAVPRFHHLAVP